MPVDGHESLRETRSPNRFVGLVGPVKSGRVSNMARTFLPKIAVVLLGAVALLAAGIPLGLYWLGLSNIEGRPEPPTQTSHVIADNQVLQRELRMQGPIVIDALNPWLFIVDALREAPRIPSEHARSMRAVGIIVGNYNSSHLRNHRMIWWHVSDMSLTIWVTRHWTTDEIVTAAAALSRSRPYPDFHN